MPAAKLHRSGLHAVLGEYAAGRGRQSGNDQPKIVFFGLTDARVRGGVSIA
jgi:hypothetical protein